MMRTEGQPRRWSCRRASCSATWGSRPSRRSRSVAATFLLIGLAARIYERSVLRIGAPISLRSALGGPAVDVSRGLLQAAAVAALIGGVVVGTEEPLGIALLATGVLLIVATGAAARRTADPLSGCDTRARGRPRGRG